MEIIFGKIDNKNVLTLQGEFTIYSASEFKIKIDANQEILKSDLTIDLSKVTRIDTSGIQVLISLKKHFNEKGFNIILINHSDAVISIIELYGLLAYFGDQIRLKKDDQGKYAFKYGRKKGYY